VPRKTTEARVLAAINPGGSPGRLRPDPALAGDAKTIFLSIVGSLDPAHFLQAEKPLLELYCVAIARSRRADAKLETMGEVLDDGRANPWLRVRMAAGKEASGLAVRLRLAPSTRLQPKQAGKGAKSVEPWDDDERKLAS
jgi:phage terminase small subunit